MKRFFNSFRYAWKGIVTALREEQNMRFHVVTAFYVYVFSLFYGFSAGEYCALTLCVFGVLALECINSALERAVDRPGPARFHIAGAVKDMAAGAVLLYAVGAAVCGVFLYMRPAVLARIFTWFTARPFWGVVLVASIILSYSFVFRKER